MVNKKEFIEQLFKRRATYADPDQAEITLNLLNKISSDIYSENKRFVYEFIQNADDSSIGGVNEVLFDFLDDCLIVSHNGTPFTSDDINAISHAGSSTKVADANKTGYKGVGFKSVFGKSKRVSIFSDGYQFRFDKGYHTTTLPWQVIPIWTEKSDLPMSAQRSLSSKIFNVSTIIELKDSAVLETELKDLLSDGEILLFLRNVKKITLKRKNVIQAEIQKSVVKLSGASSKVQLLLDGKPISSWLIRTFVKIQISPEIKKALKADEDAPPKLKQSNFTDISFAAKIDGDKITPLNKSESLIFTYLPTKVRDYEFPFLVNAGFLTNTSREALHDDQIWNKWLFQMIAKLLLSWLEELAITEYRYQTLSLLPGMGVVNASSLKIAFEKMFRATFPNCKFIIDRTDGIKTVDSVVWDRTGLSEQTFIDRVVIADYISDRGQVKIEESSFIHKGFEKTEKLLSYGVLTFELEELENFFASPHFSKHHRIEQNFSLITYFKHRSDGDSQGIWFHRLKNLPFIFNEDGLLSNPSTGICFPIGMLSTEMGKIPTIHAQVYDEILKNKEIFEWLKLLGVKEPSDLAYVTNVIIPGLKDENFITNQNYLPITGYLLRLFQDNQLDELTLSLLRELKLKTKGSEGAFKKANDCYLSDKYNPYLKIESHISGISYVSEEYLKIGQSELKLSTFFKAIKVKDRIEIETINSLRLPAIRRITSEVWVLESQKEARTKSRGGFGFEDSNIINNIKLPSFLSVLPANYLFAELFWTNIFSDNKSFSELASSAQYRYGIGNGENRYSEMVDNYFKWFINNHACIPATTEKMVSASEAYLHTKEAKQIAGKHLPVFTYENPLPTEWKQFLGLKDHLDLEDYLFVLESIALRGLDDSEIKKSEIKRVGLIYNKLTDLLTEYPEDQKTIIRTWALNNNVLTDTHTFERPGELMYINIPGFSGSALLKLIHLPSICDFNTGNFREFFSLLSIKVIDEFTPKYGNSIENIDLKNNLLTILPYFVKLIEEREGAVYEKEFNRIYKILSSTTILSATQINLAFTHLGEEILGPDLPVYFSESEFCFVGEFENPLTKFTLIPQLNKLLEVSGFNDELRLLLEIDESKIIAWFMSRNINVSEIHATPEYSKSKNKFKAKKAVTIAVTPVVNVSAETLTATPLINTPFIPKISAKNATFSQVSTYNPVPDDEIPSIVAESFAEIADNQAKLDVGRWAEEHVYEHLKTKYQKVTWVNQEKESYKPYDFIVQGNKGEELFIEVKGTPSREKNLFKISVEEWKLMFEKGSNYLIYRVYSVGNQDAQTYIIENPSHLIVKGSIVPNPIILQI